MEKQMKHQNIIALCLGIFAAALLWQYYLWPKYQLKQETPEIMSIIDESAQKELENSIDSSEQGEVLFIGEPSVTELINAPKKEEGLVFYSQANKPKDLFEVMSRNESKKYKAINIDDDNLVLDPSSISKVEQNGIYTEDDSHITMLQLPMKTLVIKNAEFYKKFLSENKGFYPKVDFSKEMIVIVLSDSKFSDNFFEIVKVDNTDNEIKVLYRVNLISANENKGQRNYKVIDNTNLPVNFIQVK